MNHHYYDRSAMTEGCSRTSPIRLPVYIAKAQDYCKPILVNDLFFERETRCLKSLVDDIANYICIPSQLFGQRKINCCKSMHGDKTRTFKYTAAKLSLVSSS